ncbi:hypothetical protein GE061_014220 [Apolygus lucorum]|uniref:Peroxiredoxin-5 n=1 Tax=Apolygus lucorum TaxID=248454 RepID=A0A8S9XSP3_APOLU|nr:hypothetical protein GE061_014220 [Apolygus lucorum]
MYLPDKFCCWPVIILKIKWKIERALLILNIYPSHSAKFNTGSFDTFTDSQMMARQRTDGGNERKKKRKNPPGLYQKKEEEKSASLYPQKSGKFLRNSDLDDNSMHFVLNSIKQSLIKTGRLNLRHIHSSSALFAMPVQVGSKIPTMDLYENSPAEKVNIGTLCNGKKVVLFAVPGAFTPGCSKTHLPGYVSGADELKAKGIDEIVCVSVNDPFVMAAWGQEHKATGKVRMLADPSGEFTKALDLAVDLPPLGGLRSKRYSMIIQDGVIAELNVEPDGTGLTCSLANNLKFKKSSS